MEVIFKYRVGQKVFYEDKLYEILSRHYMETSHNKITKYNLRAEDEFIPNVWESDLKSLSIVK